MASKALVHRPQRTVNQKNSSQPATSPGHSSEAADRFKKNETVLSFNTHTHKWITHLNIRPKIIKFIEENKGSRLLDINLGDDTLGFSPEAKATKAEISGTTSN